MKISIIFVIINVIKVGGGFMQFSVKIEKVRSILNLSQERLAKELGVSFATVNRWEKGHSEPSYLALEKFDTFCKQHDIEFGEVK